MTLHESILAFQIIITALASIAASSGFWIFMDKRRSTHDVRAKLLLGLAHERIIVLSLGYINRGWILADEFENLYTYLYVPYLEMGANGTVKRLMEEVLKLKIVNTPTEMFYQNTGEKDDFKQPSL